MINLLSLEAKRELKSARLNVVLITYCGVVGLTLAAVFILTLFSYWWLTNKTTVATAQQAANQAQTRSYDPVRTQAATFSSNLSKIQSVLSNRSHYSTALLNIGASLPKGAYITNASLSPAFVTTPLVISATTSTNQAALALKTQLEKSPIYSTVTLDTVNCKDSSCDVSLTATLKPAVFTPGAAE